MRENQQLELKFKEREQRLKEREQKLKKEKDKLNSNKRKLKEIIEFREIRSMLPKIIQKVPKKKELKEKNNNNIKTKNIDENVKDMTFQGDVQKLEKKEK